MKGVVARSRSDAKNRVHLTDARHRGQPRLVYVEPSSCASFVMGSMFSSGKKGKPKHKPRGTVSDKDRAELELKARPS